MATAEKEIRAALAALDAGIEDLQRRRMTLAALLPRRAKEVDKGYIVNRLTGKKMYYKKAKGAG